MRKKQSAFFSSCVFSRRRCWFAVFSSSFFVSVGRSALDACGFIRARSMDDQVFLSAEKQVIKADSIDAKELWDIKKASTADPPCVQ